MSTLNLESLYFLGDLHGRTDTVLRALRDAADRRCTAVIQVGDAQIYAPEQLRAIAAERAALTQDYGAAPQLHIIDGNHEDFRVLDPHAEQAVSMGGTDTDPALIYHPRGDIFTVDDVRLACFGGAVSIDRMLRTEGRDWFPQEVPTVADLHRMLDRLAAVTEPVDVLITHDIPDFAVDQAAPLRATAAELRLGNAHLVRRMLDRVADAARAPLIVHGHWHIDARGRYHRDLDADPQALAEGTELADYTTTVLSLHREDRPGNAAIVEDLRPFAGHDLEFTRLSV